MAEATSQEYIKSVKGPDEQINPRQGATASDTLSESKSLSEVFRETNRLIELGELQQARTYLEKFKDSNSFTAEERAQIARVHGMIESVITRNEQRLENENQSEK